MNVHRISLLLLFCLAVSHGANIAMYISIGSYSHFNVYKAVSEVLVEDGHNITIFNALVDYKSENISVVRVDDMVNIFKRDMSENSLFKERITDSFMPGMNYLIFDSSVSLCKAFLESSELKAVLNSDIHFDLVMVNPLFGECGLILGHHYNAPIVYLATSGFYSWATHAFANPGFSLYKGDTFLWTSHNPLHFSQRLTSTFLHGFLRFIQLWYTYPKTEALFKEHFGVDSPTIVEMERNASLIFLNSNIGVDLPMPYMPNVVEISGIHNTPSKPLSKEWSDYVEASSGIILFSLGSLVKSSHMPLSYKKALLNAFSQLPYRVIWKWDDEHMDGVTIPNNVKVTKWMPQNDLLGYNKTKLFITHGGKQSTIEALYHRVPMIVIPIFSDQDLNAFIARERRYGIFLEARELESTETVLNAINDIINNKEYENNVRKFSAIMEDQPLSPKERISYWTNYVIRHNGTPLMKSAARSMHWIEFYQVDVLFILFVIILLFTIIMVKGTRIIFKKFLNDKK